ncbi:hypothetical protein PoB_000956800 [Plakobranchus ocellatus]|uniref:Centrosome-associated FAM110 C-terminal domain-containing protein n=1 Tax=Plakobranchus ocellatus TaxID=259542 RepID=A0AAV3YLF9_9GAST|nr:hypothetical protein PoB_000956800 [Plakobranchus ocellatus]
MSLLVTSCTMGKQPDRLLHKGPDYLRTRTNHGIFSTDNRKSAVELLAASKAQFYSSMKDRTTLGRGGQDLAVTTGQHDRYRSKKDAKNEHHPPRSKSEHNLSQLKLTSLLENEVIDGNDDTDGDVNNNSSNFDNSNDDCDDTSSITTDAVIEGTQRLSLETNLSCDKHRGVLIDSETSVSIKGKKTSSKSTEPVAVPGLIGKNSNFHRSFAPRAKDTHKNANSLNLENANKASPSPRQIREKPVPSPRRRPAKVPIVPTDQHKSKQSTTTQSFTANRANGESTQNSHFKSASVFYNVALDCKDSVTNSNNPTSEPNNPYVYRSTASVSLSKPLTTTLSGKPKIPPRPSKLDATTNHPLILRQESTTPEGRGLNSEDSTIGKRKQSLVETLTKRFTSLSASTPTEASKSGENCSLNLPDKSQVLYKATPVFISKSVTPSSTSTFKAKPLYGPSPAAKSECLPSPLTAKESNRACDFTINNSLRTGRKRCPDAEDSSESYSKREKRTNDTSKVRKPKFESSLKSSKEFIAKKKSAAVVCTARQSRKSEMSIESAEQAVGESEISAVPLADMESDNPQCSSVDDGVEGQEIIRRNSSRSGRLDQGDTSQSSGGSGQRHSSGGCSSSVPRSHSDISFRLGGSSAIGGIAGENSGHAGQHSRDSSLVSSHSRLSRTSVGADLENFFNQMGLEMGVLEPIARLRELQACGSASGDGGPGGDTSTFDSMSSLDSQDAASICSTYSRSEHECAGTGGLSLGAGGGAEGPILDKGHQQTSIVERNARIIKWLCNVRKAIKGGQNKVDSGGTTSPGKA